jgi:hypothetical protein
MSHSSDSNDSIIDSTTDVRISYENGEINSLAPKNSESATTMKSSVISTVLTSPPPPVSGTKFVRLDEPTSGIYAHICYIYIYINVYVFTHIRVSIYVCICVFLNIPPSSCTILYTHR